MCGRFTLTENPETLIEELRVVDVREEPFRPRYNIAPSQAVAVIIQTPAGERRMGSMAWGLVPSWAKDPSIGSRIINARSETAAVKPSFRGPMRHRRCLIPADGFYEWKAVPGERAKQPYRIRVKGRDHFAMAGLWDQWRTPDGDSLFSFAILTMDAAPDIAEIHHRMPVILDGSAMETWLDGGITDPERLQPVIEEAAHREFEAYAVSRVVNRASNDVPEAIVPLSGPGEPGAEIGIDGL